MDFPQRPARYLLQLAAASALEYNLRIEMYDHGITCESSPHNPPHLPIRKGLSTIKTLAHFGFKSAATFLILLLGLVAGSLAQPQYYNLNTGTSSNSFPFTVAGGKAVNSLFLAREFNQPTPLPPGQQITTVYLRTSTAGTRTFTNLHILMAQDVITTLTTGTFYAGPYDTVYSNASPTLTSTVDGWMGVRLDHPYPYDPTKSLILFVGQCGATGAGMSVRNSTLTDIRRVWSVCRRSSRVEVHRRHRTTGESFLRATSTAI